jgi:hypothetical protein
LFPCRSALAPGLRLLVAAGCLLLRDRRPHRALDGTSGRACSRAFMPVSRVASYWRARAAYGQDLITLRLVGHALDDERARFRGFLVEIDDFHLSW